MYAGVYAGEKVRDDGSLSPDNEIPSSPVVVHASSTPDGASTPFEPDRDLYTSDPAISHGHTPEASPNMDPLPETTGQGANTGNTIADGSYQGVGAIEASNDPSPLSNMPSSQAIPDATHTGADVGVSPAQGGTMAGVEPHNAFPTPNSVIMAGGWQAAAQKAAFNTLPVYLPAERPLDQILFDFIQSRRGALPDGTASETSLWPQKPKMQALVNPDMIQTVDSLSAIMSRVLSTFRHVNLPEKLAFFYIMYHTARVKSFM